MDFWIESISVPMVLNLLQLVQFIHPQRTQGVWPQLIQSGAEKTISKTDNVTKLSQIYSTAETDAFVMLNYSQVNGRNKLDQKRVAQGNSARTHRFNCCTTEWEMINSQVIKQE